MGELYILLHSPPILWCDSLGITFRTVDPIFHSRTKHVEIDFHFVHENVLTTSLLFDISQFGLNWWYFNKTTITYLFLILRSKLTRSVFLDGGCWRRLKHVTKWFYNLLLKDSHCLLSKVLDNSVLIDKS